MITRIYIDNFRCLKDFEIKPGTFQLWLGGNGSGKTAVLDALRIIQRVVAGDRVDDWVKRDDSTAWIDKTDILLEADLQLGDNQYRYHLLLRYERRHEQYRIAKEVLECDNEIRFESNEICTVVYPLKHNPTDSQKSLEYSSEPIRSRIQLVPNIDKMQPIIQFREAVWNWLIVHPVPALIEPNSTRENRELKFEMQNFADWYRHVVQEDMSIALRATAQLKEVLQPGFESLNLQEWGESRRLTALYRTEGKDVTISFNKLSDGERQLIMLYVLLEALRKTHPVLIIDEPDNFVSLREVGAWLSEAEDICDENEGRQCIVISHHPNIVNRMARGSEIWFHRPNGEHTVTGEFPTCEDLSPAETMRRGMEHE